MHHEETELEERNEENKKKKDAIINPKARPKDIVKNRFDPRDMKRPVEKVITISSRKEETEAEMETIEEKIKNKAQRYADFIGKEKAKQGTTKIMGSEKKPDVKEEAEEIDEISKEKVSDYVGKAVKSKYNAVDSFNKSYNNVTSVANAGKRHDPKDSENVKKSLKTFDKRSAGLKMANKKLGEDIEVEFSEDEINFFNSLMGDE